MLVSMTLKSNRLGDTLGATGKTRWMAMDSLPGFMYFALLVLSPAYFTLSLVAISSRIDPFLGILASHGKTLTKTPYWWSIQVPKAYFCHFYAFGLLSATICFCAVNDSRLSPSWTHLLLLAHLFRRLYECVYVHHFRRESQMNLAGYLLGIGHYVVLPLVFLGRVARREVTFRTIACCLWNLWMQYEQHIHHRILAKLRQRQVPDSQPAIYSLPPNQRWFRWSLCPHYLAEILIYASWAALLAQEQTWPFTDLSSMNSSMAPWCHIVLQFAAAERHWFLLLWVATNLTVSALNNRDWYQLRYPRETSNKSALFPWLFVR